MIATIKKQQLSKNTIGVDMKNMSILLVVILGICGFIMNADDAKDSKNKKNLTISAKVDGSGKFIIKKDQITYTHLHWGKPENVLIDGKKWENLDEPFKISKEFSGAINLQKAKVLKKKGRDVVAMEKDDDSLVVYFDDSPNGSDEYEIVIAL